MFACKAFGGSGASVGRRGSASPWDPSVSSLLVDVGGVGYPLSPLWGAGVEATFALHRGFAISFFETATFPFFPDRSKFPRNGGERNGNSHCGGDAKINMWTKKMKVKKINRYRLTVMADESLARHEGLDLKV